MVTGGLDRNNNNRLASTELLKTGSVWHEIASAKLPRPMDGVSVSTLDNRVLLFGERRHVLILMLSLSHMGPCYRGEVQ